MSNWVKSDVLKRLDRWCYPAAIATGWLLSRLFSFRDASSRPLVVRPGGMGDLICVCMAIEGLGGDPQGFLWLIEKRSQPWAEHLKLDHLCYDSRPLSVLWRVAGRYRDVLNTEQRYGLAHAAALAATSRSGRLTCFDTNRGRGWATQVVAYDWDKSHEVIEFGRLLAKALDLPAFPLSPVRARLHPPTGPPIVAIAGRQSASRRLEMETWTHLVNAWAGQRPFLVSAGPSDRGVAHDLVDAFGGQGSTLDGTFSERCEAIARAEEVFTVDGGMMHVASYYGVAVTAVFTSSRERKWAPLAVGSRLIRRFDLSCQPCARFAQVPPCPWNFTCKVLEYHEHLRSL
jgi:ADP-heptose:LPS heptosyltransferase